MVVQICKVSVMALVSCERRAYARRVRFDGRFLSVSRWKVADSRRPVTCPRG